MRAAPACSAKMAIAASAWTLPGWLVSALLAHALQQHAWAPPVVQHGCEWQRWPIRLALGLQHPPTVASAVACRKGARLGCADPCAMRPHTLRPCAGDCGNPGAGQEAAFASYLSPILSEQDVPSIDDFNPGVSGSVRPISAVWCQKRTCPGTVDCNWPWVAH